MCGFCLGFQQRLFLNGKQCAAKKDGLKTISSPSLCFPSGWADFPFGRHKHWPFGREAKCLKIKGSKVRKSRLKDKPYFLGLALHWRYVDDLKLRTIVLYYLLTERELEGVGLDLGMRKRVHSR